MTRKRLRDWYADSIVTRSSLRITLTVLFATLVASSLVAVPATAATTSNHEDETTPSLVVALDDAGDAELTLTMTYDLTTENERDAFRSLEETPADQQAALDRFASRLSGVADQVANRTDRSMEVSTTDVSVTRSDEVGAIHLTVTWANLAAVEGDSLIVEEPFASGFQPEQPLTVVAPDGYQVASATPSPNEAADSHATWSAGSDLSGFEVVLEPSEDDEGDDGAPGFGLAAGVFAVLLGAVLAARGRSST